MMLKIQLWLTGINYILNYIQMENSCNNISQYYCIFYQINAVLVSIEDSYRPQTYSMNESIS